MNRGLISASWRTEVRTLPSQQNQKPQFVPGLFNFSLITIIATSYTLPEGKQVIIRIKY